MCTTLKRKLLNFYKASKFNLQNQIEIKHKLRFISINNQLTISRGKKLLELYSLMDCHRNVVDDPSRKILRSYRHIQRNLAHSLQPNMTSSQVDEKIPQIDVQSCVHLLKELYTQWLQKDVGFLFSLLLVPNQFLLSWIFVGFSTAFLFHWQNTPYVLLVEIFRSLIDISDFFTDVQHFHWLLEISLSVHKALVVDDPPCLESSITGCILKSVSFIAETVMR